ncbi:MAG: ABC transporter permease [Cyclobacteriaceae bacterium]
MLKNYFKVAVRLLWRDKLHTLINICGLGLAIACFILIASFVHHEWSYDTFHSKSDRIYRAFVKEDYGENEVFFNTVTPFALGPALKDNFAEVEAEVRLTPLASIVKIDEDQFSDPVLIVGQKFLEVFDFQATAGDSDKALQGQNNVLITKEMAIKYFGSQDPINRVISIRIGGDFEDFAVKAVIENVPRHSSIQFGLLISELNLTKLYSDQVLTSAWFNVLPETYILLEEGSNQEQLEGKFPSLFRSILGEETYANSNYTVGLQSLTSIHLDTSYPAGIAVVSNPRYSYILSAIAILVLIVACINFVTLAIGRSLKRTKEVGIRKVAGAKRTQLIFQFIGEAVIVAALSLILGLILAFMFLPTFNDLSGTELDLPFNAFFIVVVFIMIGLIGLVSGSYPAYFLSAFKPVSILKGSKLIGNNKQTLRKVLVGLQLAISIFLISSTLVMQRQLRHLQNKDLGYNKEQLAVIPLSVSGAGGLADLIRSGFTQAEQIKNELQRFPGVASSSAASHDFGTGDWTYIGYTDEEGTYRNFYLNVVDDDYIPSIELRLHSGRNFSDENPSDARQSIIVNQAFAKEYGWGNPIGQHIPGKGFDTHEVIGVVDDFNYASLYTEVAPMVMVLDPMIIFNGMENIDISTSAVPKLLVRLKAENLGNVVSQIKEVWDKITGGEEFLLTFVDQTLAAQYRSDQNLGRIVNIATILAIVLGSLGLYALASLAMQNRTKEIGIRRVLGATERTLLIYLSKDYALLVMASSLISIPITWYLMQTWLANFAHRVNITIEIFLIAGAIALMIALFAISYHIIKTVFRNPVRALRYE